jgi:hypothetical protein
MQRVTRKRMLPDYNKFQNCFLSPDSYQMLMRQKVISFRDDRSAEQ